MPGGPGEERRPGGPRGRGQAPGHRARPGPIYDVLEIAAGGRETPARDSSGPTRSGLLSPGKAVLGMIGGRAAAGPGMVPAGPGGGQFPKRRHDLGHRLLPDPGRHRPEHDRPCRRRSDRRHRPTPRSWSSSRRDPETKAVAMFGEIGTTQEERVADLIETGQVHQAAHRLHRRQGGQVGHALFPRRRHRRGRPRLLREQGPAAAGGRRPRRGRHRRHPREGQPRCWIIPKEDVCPKRRKMDDRDHRSEAEPDHGPGLSHR